MNFNVKCSYQGRLSQPDGQIQQTHSPRIAAKLWCPYELTLGGRNVERKKIYFTKLLLQGERWPLWQEVKCTGDGVHGLLVTIHSLYDHFYGSILNVRKGSDISMIQSVPHWNEVAEISSAVTGRLFRMIMNCATVCSCHSLAKITLNSAPHSMWIFW